MLMFATAGDAWFAVTQSIPAITLAQLPSSPSRQGCTRTECSVACFATP
jgi:hypothetical protein